MCVRVSYRSVSFIARIRYHEGFKVFKSCRMLVCYCKHRNPSLYILIDLDLTNRRVEERREEETESQIVPRGHSIE